MNSTEYEALVSKVATKMTNYPELIRLGTVNYGSKNKWRGASGFCHQVDVSLENDRDVLLVECKHWKENLKAETFLVQLARVIDIATGPDSKNRAVRGAIVTSRGFQRGVYKLEEHYKRCVSLFKVSSDEEFTVISHTHFIDVSSITSNGEVGTPTIMQHPPLSS